MGYKIAKYVYHSGATSPKCEVDNGQSHYRAKIKIFYLHDTEERANYPFRRKTEVLLRKRSSIFFYSYSFIWIKNYLHSKSDLILNFS